MCITMRFFWKNLMGDIDGSDSGVLCDDSDEEVCLALLMCVFMCMVCVLQCATF